jgi:hypothetical protein
MRRTSMSIAMAALVGLVAALTPPSSALAARPGPSQSAAYAALLAAPDISVDNVRAHMQSLQNIATANGGTRRSTTAGYTASVTYVYDRLVAAGFTVVKQTCSSGCTAGAGPNVIADWPGGDVNSTVMLGAHLDSVSAGPGINDNASGSAAVLEVALTLAAQNPSMLKHARFAFWTDEEQGLNGSEFYVNSLTSNRRAAISAYLNFDMVSSTNGGYFINRLTSTTGQILKAYYDSIGVPTEENVEGAGRSDDAPFNGAGIPTSGVAAGASATKTSAQVAKWGGTAGAAYDPCYHRACDTFPSNVSTTVLDRAGDAAAHALWTLAVNTPAGNDFSISTSPATGSVGPGASVATTVTTAVTSGAAQSVTLSATGLPAGAIATFTPPSVTAGGSSSLTISTTTATPSGAYTVTVVGTGTAATRSTTYTLTVTAVPGCHATSPTDVTISDNTTVESPLVVSGCAGNASSASTVEFHIVHTYRGDLVVSLVAPDSSVYTLHNRSGGSADNLDVTYRARWPTAPGGFGYRTRHPAMWATSTAGRSTSGRPRRSPVRRATTPRSRSPISPPSPAPR